MWSKSRIQHLHVLLLAFVLLFSSIPAAAPVLHAQEGEPVAPAEGAQIGSLSGKVTHNGAGLKDVTVTATMVTPTGKPQIILVPGVLGTVLTNFAAANTGCNPTGAIWIRAANLDNLRRMGPLNLQSDGVTSVVSSCDIRPDGLVKVGLWGMFEDPYSAFIQAAKSGNKYDVLDYPGYDWRLDLRSQADALDTWINNNADLSRPIHLVTHSMGGLVVRAFVSNQQRANRITSVISVAPPYLGAPLFFDRTVAGHTGSSADKYTINEQIKRLILYSPGILQLMPSLAWFTNGGGAFFDYNGSLKSTYQDSIDFLVDRGHIGQEVSVKAREFHESLDGFQSNFYATGRYTVLFSQAWDKTPVRYTYGCNNDEEDFCYLYPIATRPGDGTVPDLSASLGGMAQAARNGVSFCRYDNVYAEPVKLHGDLFNDQKVIQDILSILETGSPVNCNTNLTATAANAMPEHSEAVTHRDIVVLGDVRVRVLDDGNSFTGPNSEDFIEWNLPSVGYSLISGGVWITMPQGENFRLEIVNESKRGVAVLTSDFGPTSDPDLLMAQAKATFIDVDVAEGATATLPNAGAPLADLRLQLDTNGDGTPDKTLPPDAVLTTPEAAQDFTPPTTTIAVAGATNTEGKLTGDATITLTAQDNAGGSGLLATRYSLDGGATWQVYSAPFKVQPGLATEVQAFSTDKAGNQEQIGSKPLNFAGGARIWLPTVVNKSQPRAAAEDVEMAVAELAPEPAAPLMQGPQPAPMQAAPAQDAVAPAVVDAPAAADYVATTDGLGNYSFSNLPLGNYKVTAAKSGYSMLPFEQSAIVTALPSGTNTNINFTATAFAPGDTVLIPAGSFTMGCDPAIDPWNCSNWGWPDTPFHTVNLTAAYRIDKYEVTNERYAACVTSGGCTAPQSTQAYRCDGSGNCGSGEYYDVAAYNNHPVVNVTWHQADTYCRATGGRLPTEAEWERAARGKNDRRVWPWGNTLACSNANVYNDQQGNTCSTYGLKAVGSYPTGASPEGVMDMSGNAWEWVNDWSYRVYTEDPVSNPQGPESGSSRVLRGGSFYNYGGDTRVSVRYGDVPDGWNYGDGFRCVRSQ